MKKSDKTKLSLNCRGEILIFKKNKYTNKLIQKYEQHNMFLLNGRKKILYRLGSPACLARIILSSSTLEEDINATTIPLKIWAEESGEPTFISEQTGLSITKRMSVTVPSPSVGSSRNIGTIGIANSITGEGAICYTKLTDIITQADNEILNVYYSITLSAN